MRTYTGLYRQVYDFENLYRGYLLARKDKRYNQDVLEFTANLEENLIDLQNSLIWKTYKPGKLREMIVTDPKKRLIMAPPFRDRVLQCALAEVVRPIYEKGFIADSYGSIKERGPLKAAKRVQYWLQLIKHKSGDWYVLKADIAKYFFRIPLEVQMREMSKPIADKDIIWLYQQIIMRQDSAFGLPLDAKGFDISIRLHDRGMPAGSLIPQLEGNVVLNAADQYMKRVVRVPYYARYMDDIIIIAESKEKCQLYRQLLEGFLESYLGLNLNKKTSIFPASVPFEFVGAKVSASGLQMRKQTSLAIKRRLNSMQKQYAEGKLDYDSIKPIVMSYYGLMKHYNSFALRKRISETFVLTKKENVSNK